MFINKTRDGRNNLCGERVSQIRKSKRLSQKKLADKLQLAGLDVDKNAIQRIEAGKRFVTDIDLVYLSVVLETSISDLFDDPDALFKKT